VADRSRLSFDLLLASHHRFWVLVALFLSRKRCPIAAGLTPCLAKHIAFFYLVTL
jgi:hypothetical protein